MQTANRLNGGEIDIRKTHPNLYWLVMTLASFSLLLGLNFIIGELTTKFPSPTFPIWVAPNALWGVIFLALGAAEFVALNVYRRLTFVRFTMAFSMAYILFLAVGTTQPAIQGKGSFQLPLVYAWLFVLHIPLLLEPYINPLTRRR